MRVISYDISISPVWEYSCECKHLNIWGAQVLRNPKQKRFFKSKDIHDLFTLGDQYAGGSETASIFFSLHGGLEVPLDPDAVAVPVESSQAPGDAAPCHSCCLVYLARGYRRGITCCYMPTHQPLMRKLGENRDGQGLWGIPIRRDPKGCLFQIVHYSNLPGCRARTERSSVWGEQRQ